LGPALAVAGAGCLPLPLKKAGWDSLRVLKNSAGSSSSDFLNSETANSLYADAGVSRCALVFEEGCAGFGSFGSFGLSFCLLLRLLVFVFLAVLDFLELLFGCLGSFGLGLGSLLGCNRFLVSRAAILVGLIHEGQGFLGREFVLAVSVALAVLRLGGWGVQHLIVCGVLHLVVCHFFLRRPAP